jgi:hypothetical protein
VQLVEQRGDCLEVLILGNRILAFQCGGAVLEELLLPDVEERGLKLILVAEVRDGDAVDEMSLQDGDILDRRLVLAGTFAWGKLLPSCRITRAWGFSISG